MVYQKILIHFAFSASNIHKRSAFPYQFLPSLHSLFWMLNAEAQVKQWQLCFYLGHFGSYFMLFSFQTFFLLPALFIFRMTVGCFFQRWLTKDAFFFYFFPNWTYTLSLSGVQRYFFFLFVYPLQLFLLGYFRNVSAGLFWVLWMLLWIFPRTVIISSYIAADWIWALKV